MLSTPCKCCLSSCDIQSTQKDIKIVVNNSASTQMPAQHVICRAPSKIIHEQIIEPWKHNIIQ